MYIPQFFSAKVDVFVFIRKMIIIRLKKQIIYFFIILMIGSVVIYRVVKAAA